MSDEDREPRSNDVSTIARIRGRVQGVGFRHWTETRAKELGLRGYVRNLTDGSVEALLIGDAYSVARMLTLCAEGPESAAVDEITTTQPSDRPAPLRAGFRRAPTADPGAPAP